MSDIAHLLPCAEPVRFLAPDGTPAEPTAETAATMEDRGYTTVGVDMSELRKAGGGPKCCTCEVRS